MSSTAFLFPGQGSQSVGMMAGLSDQSLRVRQTFDAASAVLGFDLWAIVQDGPAERLDETAMTQPALLSAGIATWRVWKSLGGPTPEFLAGHSLGEYTALVAARSLDFGDAVGLVAERGRRMQAATPPGTGAMAAVLGLDEDALATVCERAAGDQVVSCANYNSPGQVVIAGHREAVERACDLALEAGARRAVPLKVSVPSHCALMEPAAEAMKDALQQVKIRPPRLPVLHNADVRTHATAEGIREALVRQLSHPVRWSELIGELASRGVSRFAECGPGKVLTGLNRRISKEFETVALTDFEAIEQCAKKWS